MHPQVRRSSSAPAAAGAVAIAFLVALPEAVAIAVLPGVARTVSVEVAVVAIAVLAVPNGIVAVVIPAVLEAAAIALRQAASQRRILIRAATRNTGDHRL